MPGHFATVACQSGQLFALPGGGLAYARGVRVIRLLLAALAFFLASRAYAQQAGDDELLRGPFPFQKENELSVHAGYALGLGDAASGTRVQVDYGLALQRGPWLDIQMGMVAGRCSDPCGVGGGQAFDVLAGAKWKYQMKVPAVPYAKLALGPIFMFPANTSNATGLLVRGAVGANYFFTDWLGFGLELSGAWGLAFYDVGAMRTGTLGSIDFMFGTEFQF
jgi:hypothetical protein